MIYTFNDTREEPLRLDMQLLLGKGEHINCVRFMQVDGQEYLVVADEVPPPPPHTLPHTFLGSPIAMPVAGKRAAQSSARQSVFEEIIDLLCALHLDAKLAASAALTLPGWRLRRKLWGS